MQVHIQLNYGLDADEYAARYANGLTPDLAPYGFHHARELEPNVTFSDDRKGSKVWNLLRRILMRGLGMDVLHAWHNRRKIFAADVVWTIIDSDYLAIAAMKHATGSDKPALIGNNIWLFEHFPRFGPLRRWFYRKMIGKVEILTVHSRSYLPIAQTYMPDVPIQLMQFGISGTTFVRPESPPTENDDGPIRILTAGNDATRDWPTMLAAFGGDSRFDVVVVSDKVSDATVAPYANVRLPRKPTIAAFKDLYLWADLVVVPMVENKYSGITVAQEAAAMGRCILSSRTGGVPTYFDEGEVLFCKVSNPTDMREVALSCTPQQRRVVAERSYQRWLQNGYTTQAMIARYHGLSCKIIDVKR